jgi:L-seryl-tRNA(Ser) seleniumtransferase
VELPSAAVRLPAELAQPLRLGDTPTVGYLDDGRLVLDLIAIDPSDDEALVEAVRAAAKSLDRLDTRPCT